MSTFVSVGNARQPFSRLLDLVQREASLLPQPVFVQYGHTPFAPCTISGQAFLSMDDFADRVRSAELVILHAGAGSVIHAVRASKVPLLMARRQHLGEHVDDHQVEFARELHVAGKAILVDDNTSLAEAARHAIELQARPGDRSAVAPMVQLVRDRLALAARHGAGS